MSDTAALDAALDALARDLNGAALEPIVRDAMAPVADHARTHVAVRNGDVRDAITVDSSHTSTGAKGAVVVQASGSGGVAREAVFLEYGTSKMPPEPFLRPALAATQDEVVRRIEAGLASVIQHHE